MKAQIISVTPFQQNCTLLWCEATLEAAVIDPGGDLDLIHRAIASARVKPVKILITHAHLDHVGGAAQLAEQLSLPVEGPQSEDQFCIDLLPTQCERYGFPPARTFTPDRWLEHGDAVTFGQETLEILHCPGHTPGHVVFFHRGERLAFVGDVLFRDSIGRTDFPRGDHATLVASIRERLFPLGDGVKFVPGHGPMSSFGEERQSNPYVGMRA